MAVARPEIAEDLLFISEPKLLAEAVRRGLDQESSRDLAPRLLAILAREGHPDLDEPRARPAAGGLVWFRRPLRVGLAAADGDPAVRALVLVDAAPVGDDGVQPGLLLHGAPDRVPPRLRPPDWETRPGVRPGGGTGPLLSWLVEADRCHDADPGFDPERELGHPHAHPRHRGERVVQMYDLFASELWLGDSGLRGIAGPVPCQGVARVGFTAIRGDKAVVVASPLVVRPVGPLGGPPTEALRPSRSRRCPRRRRFGGR